MNSLLISLLLVVGALIWSGFSRYDFFDNDPSDISWDEIDEDLWP